MNNNCAINLLVDTGNLNHETLALGRTDIFISCSLVDIFMQRSYINDHLCPAAVELNKTSANLRKKSKIMRFKIVNTLKPYSVLVPFDGNIVKVDLQACGRTISLYVAVGSPSSSLDLSTLLHGISIATKSAQTNKQNKVIGTCSGKDSPSRNQRSWFTTRTME
ncbi:hypothetical protein GQX74_015597 [Glossina fuscipes]|nr:hypothetical protein GQX74_015597 [Glossina fuscipes]